MRDTYEWPRPDESESYHRITEILGCKWSLAIFDSLKDGPKRPAQIEKLHDGLTARVLHRCLTRLQQDGIISRKSFDELSPHVEYSLTERGHDLVKVLDSIRAITKGWPMTMG